MARRTHKFPPNSRSPSLPLLVAIVGGSGAGKSWLAKKLLAALTPEATRLSLDDFYRDLSHLPPERRTTTNFDHPRAIDWSMFENALAELRQGKAARLPRYDFKTHRRLANGNVLEPKPVVLVDGLWLLRRSSLRRAFNLKIFIDCPSRTRRNRRLARDMRSRGRTRTSIIEQLRKTVEPMHVRFVIPQQKWADILLNHDFGDRDVQRIADLLTTRIRTSREPAASRNGAGADVTTLEFKSTGSLSPMIGSNSSSIQPNLPREL